MAVDPLIELHYVNKYLGEPHALQDISLTVGTGEVVVITGPSGRDGSTLYRTINRLETIESGTIELDGRPLPDGARPRTGSAPRPAWSFGVVFTLDGRAVEDRTPEEFFTDPRSDRAKDFFSEMLNH
ncbi:ATP-binding cassette domain-containing protein [Streptomyces sp. NPDC005813]|uniref:ATP-binding cassette domain-containing protein n=1 Tax=Streptomyces sp. NPDC005813 TaxID=3155592 RepID=UPI0033F79E2A